ncbi:MAG: hypothetical protein J6S24_05110 [Lentisphaeria bacterium]|jgi:hypothetical protein|nr:hypothetical protein [Lentisphaerota bacterium]MBO5765641.1 hypothetical protein [Lentisphaeria bacterium]MBO5900618.1 hypothetical protein [Lentisphaeria bacterium]MBO7153167.1 hypothetical protein [Lentisphaeria bacterium]MBR2632639.1 hypothetical protein [Lentisphaeria bacterium]
MKKFLLMLIAVAALAPAAVRGAEEPVITRGELKDKILLYLPNRVMDLLDIFSLNIGVGPVAEARLMATRYCDVGAGIGLSAKLYKDFNRQYGLGLEEGWYWSFIFVSEEQYALTESLGSVKLYSENRTGVPMPDTNTYDFFDGKRDFLAIGGSLGLLVDGNLYLHPMEWLDLGLGFLLIDIKNDDYIMDDFR